MTPAGDPAALARFAELIDAETVPLAEAAIAVAVHLGRAEQSAAELDRIKALAGAVAGTGLDDVVRHLCVTEGFRGNRQRYYDPANSLLPAVLDRRLGIPISLAVLTVDVARRLGVAASVVAMPGHVLVGDGDPPGSWIDVFDGGRTLDAAGARERFATIHGLRARFDAAYLSATPGPRVLARLLGNLVAIYARTGDAQRLLRVLELRSVIDEVAAGDRPVLARTLSTVGRFTDAARVWQQVSDVEGPGPSGAAASAASDQLRWRLN